MTDKDKMREAEIKNYFREFQWIPVELMVHLFCNKNSNEQKFKNDKKFLIRTLKRLVDERVLSFDKLRNAYYNPSLSETERKPHYDLLNALWILGQYNDVESYYAGNGKVKIVFFRKETVYEIIQLDSTSYLNTIRIINHDFEGKDRKYLPKRIAIVDNEDEANTIPDEILMELNCIALCTVDKDGNIDSYL